MNQEEADLCAQRANMQCISTNWPVYEPNPNFGMPVPPGFPPAPEFILQPRPLFANTEQSCTFTCQDGSPFVYTTPAGSFLNLTQAAANQQAYLYACQRAEQARLCISELNGPNGCLGTPYGGTVDVSTQSGMFTATIIDGALPPGLSMSQTPNSIIFEGQPTLAGNYSFTVRFEEGANVSTRGFTIYIEGITTASPLPAGSEGVPYSQAIAAANTVAPVTWFVAAGTLPAGLSLNTSTGVISGTPTAGGSYSFAIAFNDAR